MYDQLKRPKFLVLTGADRAFYEPTVPLFGPEVEAKFGSVRYDISEAGKCLALDRHTACAFHLLRSMEAGMRAISRSLGIPDPTKGNQRNWNKAMTAINEKIDEKWPPSGRLSGDGPMFEKMAANLGMMNNPYRNAAMHLEDRYTEDDARHLLALVKGFMQHVASRMDEDGLPLA